MPQQFTSRRPSSGNRSSFGGHGGRRSFGPPRRSGGNKSRKEQIDVARFIKPAQESSKEVAYIPKHNFVDFALDDQLQKNLAYKKFVTPTPIQDQVIAQGLDGQDVIGMANTGTGKTLAFGVPVVQRLMTDPKARAIILAPTRELAEQILEECKALTFSTRIKFALLIGGSAMYRQTRALEANPQLVIGTPGRTLDHVKQGNLKLDNVTIGVLDEVDRMLDMGFVTDIRKILDGISQTRQLLFFSATENKQATDLMHTFMKDPVTVSVVSGRTADTVDQNVITYTDKNDKIEKLHDFLIHDQTEKVLIFNETKRDTEKLHKELHARGFKSDSIHGGKSQGQRRRALDNFKRNNTNILVATDVAARGIDVADITHVVNYTTPQTYDDYVHRVGRAGRAGKKGYARTFIQKI